MRQQEESMLRMTKKYLYTALSILSTILIDEAPSELNLKRVESVGEFLKHCR